MKKGDVVRVYGSVDGGYEWEKNWIPFCRGSVAKIIGVVGEDEVYARFNKGETALSGITATVHPMQCRKVKSGKAKKSNKP